MDDEKKPQAAEENKDSQKNPAASKHKEMLQMLGRNNSPLVIETSPGVFAWR